MLFTSSQSQCCASGITYNYKHHYTMGEQGTLLGTGSFGSVRKYTHCNGIEYAVKSIQKCNQELGTSDIVNEIIILLQMKHHGIIQLFNVLEDKECVKLFTELCEGGELFEEIVDRTLSSTANGPPYFNEHEATHILHQVLDAVSHMHKSGVVHRDIKPENILFAANDGHFRVKIIDFGLACHHYEYDPPMIDIVGTAYYIAPEVILRKYNKSCDLWSVGVVAYTMLYGCPPFNGTTDDELYKSILRGHYYLPSCVELSTMSTSFVAKLLELSSKKRLSAPQALRHPWLELIESLK